ncbi:MAG: hypothetical protein DMG49_14510 [Acidobacteria bacterium]|nr:MAG: hypothetical protein DMG49_14510 [Acidobacteriota bacterium]
MAPLERPPSPILVQIWNADETQIFRTIVTIPKTRLEPPDKSIFEYEEGEGDSPMALNSQAIGFPPKSGGNLIVFLQRLKGRRRVRKA